VSTEPNEVVVDERDDRGAIADDIVPPMQKFFDVGDCGNEIMAEVKKMLSGGDVSTINAHNMKIMELLELGRLEGDKGSTIFDYKCKSFQQRWFEVSNKNREQEMEVDGEGEDIFVQCESLVVLRCQRGKSISYENYRVLASFSKHYKKWYPTGVQKHKWSKGNKDKDVRFLVSMMVQSGMSWKDYELENDSQFRPSCVFRVCSMDEIENVLGKLDEDLF
jgi:hypothetical protein